MNFLAALMESFLPAAAEAGGGAMSEAVAGGGMANNYVGGIPSLLQGYGGASQGLLPYIGGR